MLSIASRPVNDRGMDNREVSVQHYENFPVASILCPPRLRPAVAAIYHFARTADDIADEGNADPQQRLGDLARYRVALRECQDKVGSGSAWPQVFVPLSRAVRQHRLPLTLLEDLLDAFVQDVHNPRYADRSALLDYCRRSANPVGRLLLHLYDIDDQASLEASDAICTSLQLINFWQDLSIDLPRGRCYVPLDDAARHRIEPQALLAPGGTGSPNASRRELVRDLVAWARRTMLEGAPLARRLPGRAGWELRLVVQGGLRILEKIEAMNFDAFDHRPVIRRAEGPLLLWRAIAWRVAPP